MNEKTSFLTAKNEVLYVDTHSHPPHDAIVIVSDSVHITNCRRVRWLGMDCDACRILGSLHLCNMAANFNSLGFSESKSSSEKENESISLGNIRISEEYIPGATLPKDSPGEYKVKQLQRWLLCRGVKTTGKKEDLVQGLGVKTLCYVHLM